MSGISADLNKTYEFLHYQGSETNTTRTTIVDNVIYVDAKIDVEKIEAELERANQHYIDAMAEFNRLSTLILDTSALAKTNAKAIADNYNELTESIDYHVRALSANIKNISNELTEGFQKVEEREIELNNKIFKTKDELQIVIQNNYDALNTKIISLQDNVEDILSRTIEMDSRISKQASQLSSLLSDVQTINTEVRNLAETLTGLGKTVTDLESSVRHTTVRLEELIARNKEELQTEIRNSEEKINNKIYALSEKEKSDISILSDSINATNVLLDKQINQTYEYFNDKIANTKTAIDKEISESLDASKQYSDSLNTQINSKLDNAVIKINDDIFEVDARISTHLNIFETRADEKFGEIDEKFRNLTGKIEKYDQIIEKIQTEITEKLQEVDAKLIDVKSSIDNVKSQVEDVKADINTVNTRVNNLDDRVTIIDGKIVSLDEKIDEVADEIRDDIEGINRKKAESLYYDKNGAYDEDHNAYWYLCSCQTSPENPPRLEDIIGGPYDFGTGGGGSGIAIFG